MASNGALDARDRGAMLSRLATERFDVLVIGGGVTGAGAALDAASTAEVIDRVESTNRQNGWFAGQSPITFRRMAIKVTAKDTVRNYACFFGTDTPAS